MAHISPALYTWGSCSHSSEGRLRPEQRLPYERDAAGAGRALGQTPAFGVPLQSSPLTAQLSRPGATQQLPHPDRKGPPPPLAFGVARFLFLSLFFFNLFFLEKQHLLRPARRRSCQPPGPAPRGGANMALRALTSRSSDSGVCAALLAARPLRRVGRCDWLSAGGSGSASP